MNTTKSNIFSFYIIALISSNKQSNGNNNSLPNNNVKINENLKLKNSIIESYDINEKLIEK